MLDNYSQVVYFLFCSSSSPTQ